MINYIVRAALAEETNDGWIWVCGPSVEDLDPRTVVKMTRPGRRCSVYTEVRTIDSNFLRKYNISPRINIDRKEDTVAMAEWYRMALGICGTTNKDNETGRVSLIVKKVRIPVWRSLRAACHHPDPVVRLGTRLGILSAWLGLLGAWLGLLGVSSMSGMALTSGFGLLGLLGGLGAWTSLGPLRPRLG